MIKQAQIKFICITMGILFFVFVVIFGATDIVMNNSCDRAIEKTLNKTVESLLKDEDKAHQNSFVVVLSAESNKLVSYDQSLFNEKQIFDFVEIIESRPYLSGRIDNVYYKVTDLRNNKLLVAADMSQNVLELKSNIFKTFILLTIIYVLMFFVVWILSYYVFKPIKIAFRKQKKFISNASHELKTPVSIISANADVLKREGDNQWVENIRSQTQRIDVLVKDMLTLARIDEGNKKLPPVDFNLSDEIIKNALPFDALAFEKNKFLVLDIEENIHYKGNTESIKIIINILLENAVKYAQPNSEILVSLKKEGGRPILKVFNLGSNVPAEDSQRIFDRFYRAESSRSRDCGGSGLGLAIAKSISDANKWKISAVSRPNESMLITVVL